MNRIGNTVALALLALLFGPPAPAQTAENTATVVMLGDSTTLCSGNKAGAKLTDYVQTYLTQTDHLRVTLINSGVSGDTAKGGFARLQGAVLTHNPDVVTISFGLNDTGSLTPDEYRTSLEQIVQAVQQKSRAKILLVTSTPFNNQRHAWGKQFRAKGGLDEYMDANLCAAMRALAKKYHLPLCDLHARFRDELKKEPKRIDTFLLPDGVHLTDQGNKVAAQYLAPMIAALVTQASFGKAR